VEYRTLIANDLCSGDQTITGVLSNVCVVYSELPVNSVVNGLQHAVQVSFEVAESNNLPVYAVDGQFLLLTAYEFSCVFNEISRKPMAS
jgi:hypothetical protein